MNYNITSETVNEGTSLQESNDVINIVKNQETESEHFPEIEIPEMNQEYGESVIQTIKHHPIIDFLNKHRFWIIVATILLLLCVAGYYIYKNKTNVIGPVGIESPSATTPREPLINLLNKPVTASPTTPGNPPTTLT